MNRKVIVTVTLNAAVDKTYFVHSLTPGAVNRVRRVIAQPGGKGVNVARVARLLGEPVVATGVVGGHNGDYIEHALTRQGVRHDFVRAAGESRICLNVIPEVGASAELLEPGLAVRQETIDRLMRKLERLAAHASVIVLSGSLPAGASADLYRRFIEALSPCPAPIVLDTSGTALTHSVSACPDMVKPNAEEMSALTGDGSPDGDPDEDRLIASIAKLVRGGIGCVAVSLGAQGAMVGIESTVYRVSAVPVKPVNAVGCGDAFVAGAAVGMHRGWPAREAFRLASACGASNALQPSAGWIDPKQVRDFAETVRLDPIATC